MAHAVLEETGHRPWPLPRTPWVMKQSWPSLLFAHWRVPPEAMRRIVPPELSIDLFDGSAWIGVVPFLLRGLRLRGTPPLPGVSAFPEINVRTYVTVGGRPGIWFFSLDAASRLAVWAARRTYGLPYFRAVMSADRRDGGVLYSSRRTPGSAEPAAFEALYRPSGPAFAATEASLEHFLVERYRLYTLDRRRRVQTADIHHPPWPLQVAEADIGVNTMTRPLGIGLSGVPLLHYSERQDALIWAPRRM